MHGIFNGRLLRQQSFLRETVPDIVKARTASLSGHVGEATSGRAGCKEPAIPVVHARASQPLIIRVHFSAW